MQNCKAASKLDATSGHQQRSSQVLAQADFINITQTEDETGTSAAFFGERKHYFTS